MRGQHLLPIAAVAMMAMASVPARAQTADDFYDGSVLQDIRLTMDPVDWSTLKLHFIDDTLYLCALQWRGVTVKNVAMKSHGRGSRSGIKPALKLDMNQYVAGQTFLGLKAVVLKNSAQDPSMLRDRLAMQIFRRLGLPAPRVNSARLYVNDEYIGVYENFEHVDDVYLMRWFGENNGYLFSFDPVSTGYHFEYLGPDLSQYSPEPFNPSTHSNAPDTVSLEAMIRTVNQASDADFTAAVATYLDLKLFAHHAAIEDFLGEWDGFLGDIFGMNNFAIYRFWNKPLFQVLANDEKANFTSDSRELFHNTAANVLTRRLLAVPELRNAWLEALIKVIAVTGGANGWLEQETAREYNQIRDAVYSDPNKLIGDNNGVLGLMTNDQFDYQVAGLPDFMRKRTSFVTSAVAAAGFKLPNSGPQLNSGGVVNAASNASAVLAPGSLVTAYGAQLSSTTAQTPSAHLPGELAGVSVYVNGFVAPLQLVSPGQMNFQMPWEIGNGPATVTIIANGTLGNTVAVNVGPFSPGIFKITHADFSPVSAGSPATGGEVLLVWATGLGAVAPAVSTGEPPPSGSPVATTTNPSITVAGYSADVQFSGLSGFAGLYQVNVKLPANLAAGTATPLLMSIGGQSTTVAIATR